MHIYRDRRDAGRSLARALEGRRWHGEPLVLALPRGGVPVAYEVADALDAPLDVLTVRKLGAPGHEELALGAIASGGAQVLNEDLIAQLHVSGAAIDAVIERETSELRRRERSYRAGRAPLELDGLSVVLVDDGLATGATMSAAVQAARSLGAAEIVIAVPVGPPDTLERLACEADEVVCPEPRRDLSSVGQWFADFSQTSDDEVKRLLAEAVARTRGSSRRG